MPLAIKKGETAVFMCFYDLEGDSLYALKWYKGRKEFFRYTPKEESPIKTFALEKVKIKVDTAKSDMNRLTLVGVDPSLSGVYNCEVSAESPSFHTALVSGEMHVVETEERKPTMSNVRSKYVVGERLQATCTSGGSRPAANLTWFLNGEKIKAANIIIFERSKMKVTESTLNYSITTHSFHNGKLRLKCSASIHNTYNQSVEQEIEEEKLGSNMSLAATREAVQSSDFLGKNEGEGGNNKRHKGGFGFTAASNQPSRLNIIEITISIFFLTKILR